MKTAVGAMLLTVACYFSPIILTLLIVGVCIALRTWSAIWRVKKRATRGRCTKIKNNLYSMVKRMIVYNVAVISFFMIDREVFGDFIKLFTEIKFALTRAVACVLILIELYAVERDIKAVTGNGLIELLKKISGSAKTVKNEIKDIFSVSIILVMLVSCSPVKRHYRLVQKYPYVHQQDTVVIRDTVKIRIDGFRVDTAAAFKTLYDTIVFYKDGVTVYTYAKKETDTIYQTITRQPKTIVKQVYLKRPVIYYEKPLKWYQRTAVIFGFCILSVGVGYFFQKRS